MNTDNDVNVSGLVTELGLSRRQFMAATAGNLGTGSPDTH